MVTFQCLWGKWGLSFCEVFMTISKQQCLLMPAEFETFLKQSLCAGGNEVFVDTAAIKAYLSANDSATMLQQLADTNVLEVSPLLGTIGRWSVYIIVLSNRWLLTSHCVYFNPESTVCSFKLQASGSRFCKTLCVTIAHGYGMNQKFMPSAVWYICP